jgi:hypothetical protein
MNQKALDLFYLSPGDLVLYQHPFERRGLRPEPEPAEFTGFHVKYDELHARIRMTETGKLKLVKAKYVRPK